LGTFDPNANFPPVANAGANQSVASGAAVTLDGSGSTDSDGSITTFVWTQVSGTPLTITNADAAVASITLPTVTETTSWVFLLTVTDDEAATDTDEVEIKVNISATMTIAEARTQSLGTLITITGLVNSVNFSGSGSEYTVEDATAGIDMYLLGIPLALGLGDEITVTGPTAEYNGKYEIMPTAASDIVINSTGNTLPDPQIITAAELASNGENYESELIQINGVSNAGTGDAWPGSGSDANVAISDASGSTVMRIDKETEIDGTTEPVWPMDVIGIVSEYSGTYQILPRMLTDFVSDKVYPVFENHSRSRGFETASNELEISIDIVPGDETQSIQSAVLTYGTDGTLLNESAMWLDNGNTWMGIIPAQAANSYLQYEVIATAHTTVDAVTDISDFDSYTYGVAIASSELTTVASIQLNPVDGQVVTVEGVITIGAGILQTGLTNAYIQDGSGEGINLYNYEEIELNRGDKIRVVGVVEDYVGTDNTTTEIKNFSYQSISTGNDLPTSVSLTPAEAQLQELEGTLVQIAGTITDHFFIGGGLNLTLGEGADALKIRIWETTGVDTSGMSVGTDWSFMGVESNYRGAFQLLVAYGEDTENTTSIVQFDNKPGSFSLNPAYPNPFNPTTHLSWTLSEPSELKLMVYDIMGRERAVLADAWSEAGSFSMSWDASDLTSGVYFVRLITARETAIQKVMLLK